MNDKFRRLRGEVLAQFGLDADAAQVPELPDLMAEDLDGTRLEDWQIRLYHLWERLKQFRPDHLDEPEWRERDAMAAHIERCLGALHAASGRN